MHATMFLKRNTASRLSRLRCFRNYISHFAISIYTKRTLDLIRYTYANTPSLKRMDQLRGLLIHFVTDYPRELVSSKKFLALAEEGGPFSKDLVSLMLERTAK